MGKSKSGGDSPINLESRMSLNDTFCFECGPHVSCFTECCGKLDLRLTPYDALRLRKRLGLDSADFLDLHTITRWRTPHGLPEIMLRMDPDAGKRCPFVSEKGCSVYEDRPGACRIYPIGRASTRHPVTDEREEFYFTVKEDHCKGFAIDKTWTVREWTEDQGVDEYNELNDLLMDLYVLRTRRKEIELTSRHIEMFIMALYNLEQFREFVLKTGFLDKFEIDDELAEAVKTDDTALLRLAFLWLRLALFREPTLKPAGSVNRPGEAMNRT
jgi:Fe-S-cluster containining protein